MVYVPPVESIDTVTISTASFDAEQGMAGGAAVTVATKSGTNEFHGVAYEYHDNHRLYKRNFFLPPDRSVLTTAPRFRTMERTSVRRYGASLTRMIQSWSDPSQNV
jgi:hypothetical protein